MPITVSKFHNIIQGKFHSDCALKKTLHLMHIINKLKGKNSPETMTMTMTRTMTMTMK